MRSQYDFRLMADFVRWSFPPDGCQADKSSSETNRCSRGTTDAD